MDARQRTTAASVAAARRVLDEERVELRRLGIPGDLELTGGSSLPGLVTKGDIDLHLRVAADEFEHAVAALPRHLPAVHPEIWTDDFATFERVADGTAPAVGIAVTVAGSEHDVRFTRSWQRLAADPDLRAAYNALKLRPDGEAAKSAFFDRLAEPD